MPSTTFVDKTTVINTPWLNEVNGVVWTLFGGATTASAGRTALGLVIGTDVAPVTSPAFLGTPTAPTATVGTNTTQLATTAFVLANYNTTMTGVVAMWGTATAPSGWLLCNGASVSRTTYAALFAVLGVVFGSVDGTTFNVPDFRDRFPVGAGTTYSANSSGGSANAVVVSHTHTATVTDPGHFHFAGSNVSVQAGSDVVRDDPVGTNPTSTNTTGITVSNSTEGVSGTNANLPPYRGIYFIIKT